MSQRYLCIHGHFYQPPRENPWLEAIETQDGASPYHDWNERVNAECYDPNTLARILDDVAAREKWGRKDAITLFPESSRTAGFRPVSPRSGGH